MAAMFVFQWDYHEWGDWPIPYAECEGDIWSVDCIFIRWLLKLHIDFPPEILALKFAILLLSLVSSQWSLQ